MEKGKDKRNSQGDVFAPAEESQPGKTSKGESEQTAVRGMSALRKILYLLIPLSVKLPLLAKLILLFLLSKLLKHAVSNVLIHFLYRKNDEAFQQLIQLLLLEMRLNGGKKKERNKSNFKTVRPMVDGVYSNIQGMMKYIIRMYFFLYGIRYSGLLLPEDIDEKAELMSTPRRVSNLWVLRGAYLNLFVALLGHPGESDKAECQLHHWECKYPDPAERNLYKNIRDLYKVKYQKEYEIMMRSEYFFLLQRFCEFVQHTGRKAFSYIHLVILSTMSIYCLCRSLFLLTHHIHVLEKKKLYERCCEGGSASNELFRLLIESVAHMSEDLAREEESTCAEGNHLDDVIVHNDNDNDNDNDVDNDVDNDDDDEDDDDDLPNGQLHIYEAMQNKLRLCLNMINRIKNKHPRYATKMLVKQKQARAQDLPGYEQPVPTCEPHKQKEVYETEPSNGQTEGETAFDDPISQRKEEQRDGSLTYSVYLYESRTDEKETQREIKRQMESTSVENISAEHSSQQRQSQREKKEENRTEGNRTNAPIDNHIACCGNVDEMDKKHMEGGSSPHHCADPHGRSKPPSNLSYEVLINELKGTFTKKKRYIYLRKKLCFDESVGEFVMREVSSNGKGRSAEGGVDQSVDHPSVDHLSVDHPSVDHPSVDDRSDDSGGTKQRSHVRAPSGENTREEDHLRPMVDVSTFRQSIAAAISRDRNI
ncbi:conserved Plasmodium protein, unknown function [Plasmodium knowlesi strain H]|uniref:Uncharacterized protein n=3 Tax=Plasmodium knowlesi TaxID=5850 RepID=A0A5K1VTD6_PLAKH|nr:conserved Plasmodium protein, unknown function [Plasmodium knowlesi strain H]OTN63669.1 Uncharacterized protein PKNOH_S140267200 [Plasmodium knowlesi]CAA9991086.1 conserved Plasmodium protein, unknown function [Plasmodium knowlesi strain H]SBO20616.1 conserved Plasmodium protein, unknown function [Plasmodium knowlesi strain H]SBO21023.1 conserved Plasmodium protein, unknown function [Plasmodium knowlesi strain H]VVS80560.1 conserved Plasmodium protein, unknown function [Plasmodium knowlesi |eukprot:XP_002262368.1 hypothetical protein, conserved in Plasmodium species [Plasmodium knowlesi strain H]